MGTLYLVRVLRVRRWHIFTIVFGVIAFLMTVGLGAQETDCSSEATHNWVVDTLTAAKQNVMHDDAQAEKQTEAVEKVASACIDANIDADRYRYARAWATLEDAIARLASGDPHSSAIFKSGITEAQALADDTNANPVVRKMAKDLVTMSKVEWNEIRSMH